MAQLLSLEQRRNVGGAAGWIAHKRLFSFIAVINCLHLNSWQPIYGPLSEQQERRWLKAMEMGGGEVRYDLVGGCRAVHFFCTCGRAFAAPPSFRSWAFFLPCVASILFGNQVEWPARSVCFFFFFSCPFLISTAQLPRNPRNALCWKLLFLYVLRNFTRQKKKTSRKWLGNWANNNSSSPSESRISNRWSWCQSSTSGLQDLRTQRQ